MGTKSTSRMFIERLRELIGTKKVKDFADEIGIVQNIIESYIIGVWNPHLENLSRICTLCDVSADWLLGLSDVRAADMELKQVCEYTGLPESTVKKLHALSISSEKNRVSESVDRLADIIIANISDDK